MFRQFTFQQRVYVEDTDFSGVVYHSNYLKYMERARTEILEEINCGIDTIAANGCFFCVVHVDINYKKPVSLNKKLHIVSEITSQKIMSLTFTQRIYLEETQELVCDGVIKLACLNPSMEPIPVPNTIKEALA